ncbi:MAG TPA: hypothetical protein VN476_02935, partial [Pyrinomonadaceae bacterium]|nr:hypothetical protein [Pyrinomonadaceae bacterium]
FPGKSGVKQHRELRDRRVAKLVRELLKQSTREVFAFRNGDDQLTDVKRRHINQHIKEVMGHNFSAKDFRTWAGTLICACALARAANVNGEKKVRKQQWVAAIKETAEALGNTPAVCRKSYVCPVLLTKFEKGSVIDHYFQNVNEVINYRGTTLHRAEKALLKFLKKEAPH